MTFERVHREIEGATAPTTLAADESSGGLGVKMTFERVHREIEGATPQAMACASFPYASQFRPACKRC